MTPFQRSIFYFSLIVFLQLFAITQSYGQDPQFSQFYASQLYLNPAFAGGGEEGRMGINYRNQWPSLPASFVTYTAWADFALPEYNSGLGILIMTDQEGQAGLRSTTAALSYAYQLQLSKTLTFRPGVSVGYMRRNVDFSQLVFASQLDPTGGFDPNLPNLTNSGLNTNLMSIDLGGLFYTERAWLGASFAHVNQPNESLTGEISTLPMRTSIHGGWKIPLASGPRKYELAYTFKERAVVPVFQYRSQANFQQLDIGSYLYLEPLVVGLWYRGLPVGMLNTLPYNESLIMLVGLSYDNLSVGYSYDFTVSRFGASSGGAHELSITYLFPISDERRPVVNKRPIPLPKF